ncbi:exopolysaccharide biosynthesis protein [Halomonas sp. FeN2]|uniref:exopolysaccharide biosynthesis protein n=1 Tax=Halomonas sp. FeN2 TaxID=2832500 RepID=UPI001D0ABA88|nr:exopolysaccharide biosynthesis protein [Halomonas sp. FeN2]UBR51795.1 exopolysaccharide biosynthesis protein [Halomonas sp. FeN2]
MSGDNSSLASALRVLPDRLPAGRPTLNDILSALGDRGLGLVLLIFSIPAIIPTPGIPAGMIFGSALALLGGQMVVGAQRVRLPSFIAQRRIGQEVLRQVFQRATPLIDKLERRLSIRLAGLMSPLAMRVIGGVIVVMALLIALPIPFGNTLPGLAILALSLGLARQDGIAVLVGMSLAVLASGVSVALLHGSLRLFDMIH